MTSVLRAVVTPTALLRLGLAWAAVVALAVAGPLLEPPVPGPLLSAVLLTIIAVILVAAFGVVHEAEHLARRLGDPYGSLVLTLSIVLIEVVLIAAVMLGPGEHATIARDSVYAVMMVILNLVIGAGLLIGGLRHGDLAPNRTGTSTYLGMIALFGTLAFVLPAVAGTDGAYTPGQEIPIIVVTLAAYAWFLQRQTGPQAHDYREIDDRFTGAADADDGADTREPIGAIVARHRTEILLRLVVLVVTMIPIVLVSHDMAELLDDGLGRVGAPVALAGIVIAIIVFTPESITAIRAAANGEIQRVVNLCHGAIVSTVGLTIPAVLVIGLLTGQTVVLAANPTELVLIAVTVVLSVITFQAPRATATHGVMHLALFAVFGVMVFAAP